MSRTARQAHTNSRPQQVRRHLRRALGRERNPLGRSRSRSLALAATGFATAALLGSGAGLAGLHSGERHARLAAVHLHRVDAVLLGPAVPPAAATSTGSARYRAELSWTYPPGQPHTGAAELPGRLAAGAGTRLWVGDTGLIAAAPPGGTDLVCDAAVLGLFTLGGLSVLLASGLGLRLRTLDRRAVQTWQHAWAQVEPGWTGRAGRGAKDGG